MNRREALALLAAVPFAARLGAQTRASAQLRFAISVTHGLLLLPDGTLKSWWRTPGSADRQGEAADSMGLGHNNLIDPHTLYPVPGITNVKAVAASPGASFAVLADGRVLAWGDTGSGELGITPRAEFETRAQPRQRSRTPTAVDVQFEAVDVSCRGDHVLALARDGSVYSWGVVPSASSASGHCRPWRSRPSRLASCPSFRIQCVSPASPASRRSALVTRTLSRCSRTVPCGRGGENRWGQLGDGTTMNRDRPRVVQGVRNAVAIAAAGEQSAAVLADGTAVEWGSTFANHKPRPILTPVPAARGLKSIVAGGAPFAALTQTGEVMTWGADAHYEIGRGGNPLAAALVPGVTNVAALAAAHSSTIVVMSSGRIVTWGEVRPWTRPGNGQGNLSPSPILLWIDGLDQP